MSVAARPASRAVDWLALCVCNAIWASQFVLVKLVGAESGPIAITAYPMLAATLLLAPFVRRRARPPARDLLAFALLGIGGQVVAQLFVTWGATRTTATDGALLQLALPIATAVMAVVVLREKMTLLRWVALVLALAGVVAGSGLDLGTSELASRGNLVGNGLIFVGILGSAFYNVYGKKLLARYSPLELLFYSYVAASAVLLPLALTLEPGSLGRLTSLSSRAWIGLVLLAVAQYWGSMLIFLAVLARLDATQAAISNYLIPFFGVVIAAVVLGERLTGAMVAGGLLVLASTLVVTVWEERIAARACRLPEGERLPVKGPTE